ncbi:hypothetical protein AURDEDRAFT_176590 [Auricularia subglabra TFB-10046 SS5]|nr:hypothetical protein AURDEDRAFT_176590 [Auricularia subglabra TFB-10046 SS5]
MRAADETMRMVAAHYPPGTSSGLTIRRAALVPQQAEFVDFLIMGAAGRRRTFVHPLAAAPNCPLLRPRGPQDAWALQFRGLSLATSLWAPLGRRLPPYPRLHVLEIFVDDGRLPAASAGRMRRESVAELRAVCVRAERTLVLDAKAVLMFLSRVAATRQRRMDLRFVNVRLEGDRDAMDMLTKVYRIS